MIEAMSFLVHGGLIPEQKPPTGGIMHTDAEARRAALSKLDALVGEWRMEASFADAPAGRAVFEWLAGGQFLVQRWEVPHPQAPDGIAIIGLAPEGGGYSQHYFDSRGVARVYAMGLEEGMWTLLRERPDFSPLDFSQRFSGRFSAGGDEISGRWEKSRGGSGWEPDFDLVYTREGQT